MLRRLPPSPSLWRISRLLAITLYIIALIFPTSSSAYTLTTPRTSATLISDVKTIHAGEKFWVALHIELQPGWHTYWVNPGDSGITPQFKWTLPNGFTAGPIVYLAPDRENVGPLVDYAYSRDAYYLVSITPPPILREGATAILALKASWLVCKDICVPESGELSLSLPASDKAEPSDDASLMAGLLGKIPMPVTVPVGFEKNSTDIQFQVPLSAMGLAPDSIKTALFFPESDRFIANAGEQKISITKEAVSVTAPIAEGMIADTATGVLSLSLISGERRDFALHLQSQASAAQVAAVENSPAVSTSSADTPHADVTLGLAIWYALIGGLILNCMPCVFPVLSLKALAISRKASAHPAEARRQGMAYAVGVIASFLLLAFALCLLKQGGQVIGWGYQMQSPLFVSLLALLLFTVGLNLAGYFELPVLLGNVGSDTASKDSAWGSLLTGVLAVVVATPCTAPFMASAIGFALTQNAAAIFVVFAALGLGLASPFLLVSFYPGLIRALPKPGAWMNSFKELLAFPMFGWTVWLVWILAREASAEAAATILLGMILIAFGLWLMRRSARIWRLLGIVAIIAAMGTAVVATHMPAMPTASIANEKAEHFTAAKLDALRKAGKAVFVDATADWCLICKVNETVALSSPEIKKAFKDKQVIYMVADWTHGDEAITHYLESFGRSGVPIYVYYPPGDGAPIVLPQVLTPSTVLEVLQ